MMSTLLNRIEKPTYQNDKIRILNYIDPPTDKSGYFDYGIVPANIYLEVDYTTLDFISTQGILLGNERINPRITVNTAITTSGVLITSASANIVNSTYTISEDVDKNIIINDTNFIANGRVAATFTRAEGEYHLYIGLVTGYKYRLKDRLRKVIIGNEIYLPAIHDDLGVGLYCREIDRFLDNKGDSPFIPSEQ